MVSVRDKLPFPKEANFLESQSFYADLRRRNTHETISAPVSCVVVALARNCASTSNVFCRDIDNSGSGEGKPFQLRKSGNRSFWTNEEVTNEGLKFGCELQYLVVTYYQSLLRRCCKLGEQDEKQFIFYRNTGEKPQDVDRILMEFKGDENVYGGLEEAHEYHNQKDMGTLIKALVSSARTFLELYETHEYLKTKDVLEIHLGFKNLFRAHGKLLKKALECFNQKDVVELHLGFIYLSSAYGELFKKTFECCNQKDVDRILRDLQGDEIVYVGLEEAHEYYNQKDVDKTPPDFQDDESVHGGLKEAHEYHNPKAHRFQGYLGKLYIKLHMSRTRIYFIGIKAFTINNERITLETMDKELLDMPLNCRGSLVLSTVPVHLQLERPREVGVDDGDDHDVPGVAVVKFGACGLTCEGLISRYKPFIISRDKELVDIQKACGEVIPVPEHWRVLFDTGNEVATSISRKCLLELNLQPDPSSKRKVKLAGGGSDQFETVAIELIIRGYHFKVFALIDAVAEGTDLLVGMDIIKKLFDSGYTIGD